MTPALILFFAEFFAACLFACVIGWALGEEAAFNDFEEDMRAADRERIKARIRYAATGHNGFDWQYRRLESDERAVA
jgi:hypothetical protein